MTPPAETARSYDLATLAAFWRRASGFWTGPARGRAWFLTLGLGLVLIANVFAQLGVNQWHGWFFGALERRDARAAGTALFAFGGLVLAVAAVGVAIVWFREMLQVRWRQDLMRALTDAWLRARSLGHTVPFDAKANPEYRIADDTRLALEPAVDLAIGLVSALLSVVTFLGVLWSVGGSLTLGGVVIPAYMVLGAVAYGVLVSGLMLYFGRKLPRSVAARNAEEARLRFALTEARIGPPERAIGLAASPLRASVHAAIDEVVRRWTRLVTLHAQLTWITNGSSALIPIVPLLLAAPKYFSGAFGIGQVVQLAAAFVAVQTAVSWFVDNFRRIAECYASAARLVELEQAIVGPAEETAAAPVPAAVPKLTP